MKLRPDDKMHNVLVDPVWPVIWQYLEIIYLVSISHVRRKTEKGLKESKLRMLLLDIPGLASGGAPDGVRSAHCSFSCNTKFTIEPYCSLIE